MLGRMMFFAMTAIVCLQGCGPAKPTTYPVTGSVTFSGKPIETGSIVFDPVDGQGVAAMGTIENGQFTAQVPKGEKTLRITGSRVTDEKDQYGEVVTESYIPEKYNSKSELRKTVASDGENKFDLVLDK